MGFATDFRSYLNGFIIIIIIIIFGVGHDGLEDQIGAEWTFNESNLLRIFLENHRRDL
jgi:hypothetical protein